MRLLKILVVPAVLSAALAPASAAHLSAEELAFLRLTNEARAAAGRPPLVLQRDLVDGAREQSREMLSVGEIFHSLDLEGRISTAWTVIGENVGRGYDVEDIQRAFMASPTHRANILDHDYTQVGIGTVIRESDGRIFVTVIFVRRSLDRSLPITEVAEAAPAFQRPTMAMKSTAPSPQRGTSPPRVGDEGPTTTIGMLVALSEMDSGLAATPVTYLPVA